MSKITRFVFALLFFLAVSGWSLVIVLGTQVLPQVETPSAELENAARAFVTNYIEVQAEGDRYEKVYPFVTGDALAQLQAENAADPEPLGDIEIIDSEFSTLFRDGPVALVEADFSIRQRSTETHIGEHFLFRYENNRWLISDRWRITIDPGTPVVPGSSAAPGQSTAPSSEPEASATPLGVPAESADPAAEAGG